VNGQGGRGKIVVTGT